MSIISIGRLTEQERELEIWVVRQRNKRQAAVFAATASRRPRQTWLNRKPPSQPRPR
jgi:hypothetical protein